MRAGLLAPLFVCTLEERMKKIVTLVVLCALLFVDNAFAQDDLLFTVNIPLVAGRQVRVNRPNGESRQIGAVVSVPTRTLWPAFEASRWGQPGSVVASSVNAIHILLGVERGRGRIISLLATYTTAPAARTTGSVLIEGVGGTGIWAAWAPAVGTPVYAVDAHGKRSPLSTESLNQAKSLEYDVLIKRNAPYYVEIENKLDGNVTVMWPNRAVVVGRVVHPVTGIGYFDGTQYQSTGRIRANHPGVVCIATAPHGVRAGFQIIPLANARSPEMKAAWSEPQWMIIEPIVAEYSAAGKAPLFSLLLVPGPHPRDNADWLWGSILHIPQVQYRTESGEWVDFPEVTQNTPDSPMKKMTHFRIMFPFPFQQ